MKNKIIELLRSTKREGMENVIDFLESKSDFFTAPASTNFHGNYEGGLAEHSLNCCQLGLKLRDVVIAQKPETALKLTEENVIIATLLHDVCKANIYKEEIKSRKGAAGNWEKYKGYTVDYSKFPLGHGEKSVIMLLMIGLKLTPDEIMAIRWHMSAWDLPMQSHELQSCYSTAKNLSPLCSILQASDCLASGILEETRKPESL
ncbi:MAG: HD family phosphohydrolase [Bacteroidales bacterium]|nr:HD family phosphohydrolase [Bacteroidales bacterium]